MTSLPDLRTTALNNAGIPLQEHTRFYEIGQSLQDLFTFHKCSEMEEMMNIVFVLLGGNPNQQRVRVDDAKKSHAVKPLPKELDDFTTISELAVLRELKLQSKKVTEEWEATNFQHVELRMELTGIISKLEPVVSQEVMRMKEDVELRQQLMRVLVSSYDSFNGVYGALWHNIEMSEINALKRYSMMSGTFRNCITASKAEGHECKQSSENLIDLYLSYAVTNEPFTKIMEEITETIDGAKWKKGPAKQPFRMVEKKFLRPSAEGFSKVCDAGRGMLEAESMDVVCDVKQAIMDRSNKDAKVKVVRIKERYQCASGGGWRDDLINIKVILENGIYHVYEVQIVHAKMLTARKELDGHAIFSKNRNATELLVSSFGDFAPSLAITVVKTGEDMIAWAQENGWFVKGNLHEWAGVIFGDDGNFKGFDITGLMDERLVANFLQALEFCAPKCLVYTNAGSSEFVHMIHSKSMNVISSISHITA